ncbi:MAG: hypothetical protein ACYYKD_11510 [Rhodospirillales bacterium]
MAKAQPADAPGEDGDAPEKQPLIDGKMWAIIAVFAVVMLLVFAAPTLIVLGVGMLPAIVAGVVDKSDERYAVYSVLSLNFCGVFPFIFGMWLDEHTFIAALETVTSPYAMAVMYAAAALGWLLYLSVPPVIAQFLSVLAQRRVNSLRDKQREMMEEWGIETAGGADISALGLPPEAGGGKGGGDDDDNDDDDDDDDGGLAPPG